MAVELDVLGSIVGSVHLGIREALKDVRESSDTDGLEALTSHVLSSSENDRLQIG